MSEHREEFEGRLKRLQKKRKKALRSSRSAFIDTDGYVIVRTRRSGGNIPLLGLTVLALGFFGLKGVMIAQLGEERYSEKVQSMLNNQSTISQVGAWTMQTDPLSLYIAENFNEIL